MERSKSLRSGGRSTSGWTEAAGLEVRGGARLCAGGGAVARDFVSMEARWRGERTNGPVKGPQGHRRSEPRFENQR